jgi:hypothetical protein
MSEECDKTFSSKRVQRVQLLHNAM